MVLYVWLYDTFTTAGNQSLQRFTVSTDLGIRILFAPDYQL
jgi:hypothetical protein